MTAPGAPRIVVLGMMSKMPVAGAVWQTVHYLAGLERLGYEAWYVEAHARTPTMLMEREEDDGAALAAGFIDRVLRRFDLGGRWAYHALHDDGRCFGMSERELRKLYRSAALIINLHGGTEPLPEHYETERLVYVETDPVLLQIELDRGLQRTIDFLEPHVAFFTFGENYGRPDCLLPVSDRFPFRPTRQPVVLDFWANDDPPSRHVFTTVGNWQQVGRSVEYRGESYSWSKHDQFLKVLDLPRRTGSGFELALSSYEESDRALLEDHGWAVRPGLEISRAPDPYREYILASKGEFTVAKDQNVRLRSGWFSDRSATYLAAGRPVVTQDTGFGNILPTGDGLFGFSDLEEATAAVEEVESDYPRHQAAAADLAQEYFSAPVVIGELLSGVGLPSLAPRRRSTDRDQASSTDVVDLAAQVARAEAEVAQLRTALASMSAWEAELAGMLREMDRGRSDDSKRMRYVGMLLGLRAAVEAVVPAGSDIALVAKGGDALLTFSGRGVQCIPQDGRGEPLSFNPHCTRAAIAQVEVARWRGADYFVVPRWSSWWLETYPGLGHHLDGRYRRVRQGDDGVIWSLRESAAVRWLSDAIEQCEHLLGRPPVILDWGAGVELDAMFPQCPVFAAEGDVLPFLDDTIDVVAVGSREGPQVREAERVASLAVAVFGSGDERAAAEVHWAEDRCLGLDPMVSIVMRERPGSPITPRSVAMLVESLPAYVPSEILLVGDGRADLPPLPGSPDGGTPGPTITAVTACVSVPDVGRAAKGETVVVVDSSTVLLPGWLPPLLRGLRAAPGAGVVCGMVIAADGALVQPASPPRTAGSSAYEIDAPRHNHVREVDDCLGTFFAVPGELFPAVAERTVGDAMGIAASAVARRANRAIVYQPDAIAVRLAEPEGVHHG